MDSDNLLSWLGSDCSKFCLIVQVSAQTRTRLTLDVGVAIRLYVVHGGSAVDSGNLSMVVA